MGKSSRCESIVIQFLSTTSWASEVSKKEGPFEKSSYHTAIYVLLWNMQKVDDHFSGPKAAVEIEERERSPAPATTTADEGYTFKAIDIQAAQKASS